MKCLDCEIRKENLAPNLMVYEHLHRSANFICVADKGTMGEGLFNFFIEEQKNISSTKGAFFQKEKWRFRRKHNLS